MCLRGRKGFTKHHYSRFSLWSNQFQPTNRWLIRKVGANGAGFTLIELLVVISIIGLLSALIIVSVSGAQKKAKDTQRKNSSKTIAGAISQYQIDQNKYFVDSSNTAISINTPTNNLASALVPLYLVTNGAFNSSLTAKYFANGAGTSYAQAWLLESDTESAANSGNGVYTTYGEAYPGTVLLPSTTSSAIIFSVANSNRILIPDSTFTNIGQFSISLWAKRAQATNSERIIAKQSYFSGGPGLRGSWSLHSGAAANNQLICEMYIGGNWRTATGPINSFPLGVWNHVGCVYDGVRVRLYINGVQVADNGVNLSGNLIATSGTSNYGISVGSRTDIIGGVFPPSPDFFTGSISDIHLYKNLVLDNADYLNFYNGSPDLVTKNAIGLWRLATYSGSSTPYSGTVTNNGTINGSVSLTDSTPNNPIRIEGIGTSQTGKAFVTYGPQ